jgi:hypothetical protein
MTTTTGLLAINRNGGLRLETRLPILVRAGLKVTLAPAWNKAAILESCVPPQEWTVS